MGQITAPEEVERFAAYLRGLRQRAGISFGELAKRTGVSKASIHRYCSGIKVPASYGVVHAIAKECGGNSKELQELHRLWALADAARSSARAKDEGDREVKESSDPAAQSPRPPVSQSRRRKRYNAVPITAAAVTAAAIMTTFIAFVPKAREKQHGPSGTATPIRVYNIEGNCKSRTDRVPACSMGLAIDPRRKYDADNVVSHRVWHGDVLYADCVVYDGDRVLDETGVGTTRWYRVRLDDVPAGHAWLPAVRTNDYPRLPTC